MGWAWCALPDFTDIVIGQSPSSQTYNSSGEGLPFFQGKGEFGSLYPQIRLYCSQPKKIAHPGATLLSVRAPVGPTNLARQKCCIGRGLAAIHPCGGMAPKFLLYMFRSIESTLSREGAGSTFKAITKRAVEDIEFRIPPLSEQKRILFRIDELFSELDVGVESLEKARAQLVTYRQAILKHAFEGKLTAQWRKENKDRVEPPDQLLARIEEEYMVRYEAQFRDREAMVGVRDVTDKKSKRASKPRRPVGVLDTDEVAHLPSLPEGYVYAFLGTLGVLDRGVSKHRPRNAPELFGGPYPFIQTGDIRAADGVIQEFRQAYNERGLEQSRLWPRGTLCITIAANIAETAILGFDSCFPDSVVGFRATYALVVPRYVELFIRLVQTQLKAYAPATAQKNINLAVLDRLIIPICSLREQRVIVDRLEAILSVVQAQLEEIDSSIRTAAAIRQSILQRAFTGRLVGQRTDDEPATVLMERIRAERGTTKSTSRRRIHTRKDPKVAT